jgi:serine/threonine protein kinase
MTTRERVSMENLQGTTLGQYELGALLGRGNRASVYRATPVGGGPTVSVRVFDPELTAEPQFAERFRRHAGKLRAVRHPHLVAVIDHDEQDGRAFLVRPYVSGSTFRQMLGTPIPLAEALRVLRPIAAALDHAHEKGLIHGDVKPGNILLTRTGEIALADLGIAELLPRGNSLLMAATGKSYGTPEYLSPEQAHALALDGRTDQYALAIILYEALVGRPPFRAERPADTPRAIAARHITAPPPNPHSLNPDVSLAVERVLLRALDKDPQRRYASCLAFLAAIAEAAPADTGPIGILALPDAVGALFTPEVTTDALPTAENDTAPLPVDPHAGTILLPALPAEAPPPAGDSDTLDKLATRHAAELRQLSASYEAQIAAQTATLRDQEANIAALTRQLAEARDRQDQLIAELAIVAHERDTLRARRRQSGPISAPLSIAEEGEAEGDARISVLDSQLYGLPRGASFSLRPGTTIGRHPDSAILLDDAFVSAHHAQVSHEDDAWWITDLGTKNGTFVNGTPIKAPTRLKTGDVLRFGRVRASFA